MVVSELYNLNSSQVEDIKVLIEELNPGIHFEKERLFNVLESSNSHLFALLGDDCHIIGCATLCVYDSPTGQKASVEDVVVSSRYRGQGLGKMMMKHMIEYARRELKTVDIHLTSNPYRDAANRLYQRLGFEKRETNAYVMKIDEL